MLTVLRSIGWLGLVGCVCVGGGLGAGRASAADLVAARLGPGQTIRVDGRLDEPAWAQAPASGGFSRLAGSGAPAVGTRFRVLADDRAIYVGVTCQEPAVDRLGAAAAVPRDHEQVAEQDRVALFLQPEGGGLKFYQFEVTADNAQADTFVAEVGNETFASYSAGWGSAVHRGEGVWTLEMRIPLTALWHTRSRAFSDPWRLNVARYRYTGTGVDRVAEVTSWSPLVAGVHEPARFRTVAGLPAKPSGQDVALLTATPTVERLLETSFPGAAEGALGGDPGSDLGETSVGEGGVEVRTFAGERAAGAYQLELAWEGLDRVVRRPVTLPVETDWLVVDRVPLPVGQPRVLRMTLLDASGEDALLTVFQEVEARLEPVELLIDQPFYADCIFADQAITQVRGRVRLGLPEARLRGAVLRVRAQGPGVETESEAPIEPGSGRPVDFAVDVSGLSAGDLVLSAQVVRDGRVLAGASRTIRKLAPNPVGSTVYLDRDRNLVVDGRPVIVRDWYAPGYMVSQRQAARWPEPRRAIPACDYGQEVGAQYNRIDPDDGARARRDVMPSDRVRDTIRQIAEAGRDNPALWFYYLADEPEVRNISPVYLRHCYDVIKQADPYHPVMIITRSPERYAGCADILSPHAYLRPVVGAQGDRSMRSPKRIRDQIRAIDRGSAGRVAPWLTPQSFTYGFKDVRADWPTFEESRCMIWTALAHGAKGIKPFIWGDTVKHSASLIGYRCIYSSIERLEPFLLAPPPPEVSPARPTPEVAPARLDVRPSVVDAVDASLHQVNGHTLLVVVNLIDQPVTARVQSPALAVYRELDRFREPGQVAVTDGAVALSLAPYQVVLLTDTPQDAGLASLAEVRSQIAEAAAGQRRPGNLLRGRGREITWGSSSDYIPPMGLAVPMTDGNRDGLAWRHMNGDATPWVELGFEAFVPTFQTVVVSGCRLGGMQMQVWEADRWRTVAVADADPGYEVTWVLDRPWCVERLRLVMPGSDQDTETLPPSSQGRRAELYEVELYAPTPSPPLSSSPAAPSSALPSPTTVPGA